MKIVSKNIVKNFGIDFGYCPQADNFQRSDFSLQEMWPKKWTFDSVLFELLVIILHLQIIKQEMKYDIQLPEDQIWRT